MSLSFGQISAQIKSVWQQKEISKTSKLARVNQHENTEGELYFTLDVSNFKQSLVNTKDKFSKQKGVIVEFPNLNGEMEQFQVWENSNMTPDFQVQFPDIRAYVGKGISDKGATINFSVSPQGIQTILFRPNGSTEFIEGYDKQSTSYVLFGDANRNKKSLVCTTKANHVALNQAPSNTTNKASNQTYKTLRLALSCTGEYAAYFGASTSGTAADKALVIAAMNATMTRVNGIYEKDLAVHLNMIDNTNVIYYNSSTDPYSAAASMDNWNYQLMNVLHVANFNAAGTGDSAFDIGHMFGASGGGGNAGCIGCICSNDVSYSVDTSVTPNVNVPNNYKGSGITSPADNVPAGDSFDVDFVAHEMGHQLGGNHTFSFGYEGSYVAVGVDDVQTEPASGSTIMAYAGVTNYNVQWHSDPFFSYRSINQIQLTLASVSCPVSVAMTDAVPVVSAGADYTIPVGTAFMLTGTASDSDASDVLTYIWEQNDCMTSTQTGTKSEAIQTKASGPNWRTFKPSANKFRYFPQMGKILAGTLAVTSTTASSSAGTPIVNNESVSSVARTLNFTFTARDNHAGGGQTAEDATVITVSATGGAFSVSSQNTTGISYPAGSTQTVTWVKGSTDVAPFNSPTVDILLSTNVSTALETDSSSNLSTTPNSTTWTTIASGVPNNGSYAVTIPSSTPVSSTCRFMVKAVGNVFLAVNSKNFAVSALANEDFSFSNFTLYPNPNKGSFNVKFNSNTSNDIKVAVYDMRGRAIFEKAYQNTGTFDQNVQLESVQSGVYLVNIQDGDKKVVKKIVIE
jgi:hypothetical protein